MKITTAVVVSIRFLTSLGFLISVILILYSKKRNIEATLVKSSPADKVNAHSEVIAVSSLIICCIVISLFGIFGGCTFFYNSVSLFGETKYKIFILIILYIFTSIMDYSIHI